MDEPFSDVRRRASWNLLRVKYFGAREPLVPGRRRQPTDFRTARVRPLPCPGSAWTRRPSTGTAATRCGRPFAVVYRRSWHDVPIPMAVACPHCGSWEVVMVPTGAVRERDGAYVLPLDYGVTALSA